jgi:molybdopterin-guanine dinucleotide biosynthesis protein A
MRLLGAILCGGRSTRFGSDKALALLDDRPLIEHVRATLAEQADAVIACGRAVAGLDWVADRPQPDLGPLGGLNAALHVAAARYFDAVLSVPCDAPRLPTDLVRQLTGEVPAYVADLPVIGLWPVALAPLLDQHIAADTRRSMRGWAGCAGARPVTLMAPIPQANTPAELDRLRAVKA